MSQSAYRRTCARTLDRPILIFGLEPEDLVGIGVAAIVVLFLVDGAVAVGVGLAGWIVLLKLKAGKPPGYLYYLAHRAGLLDRLPAAWRAPQVLPRRCTHLSPFPGETDDELARDWWSARPFAPLEDPRGRLETGGGQPGAPVDGRGGGRRGTFVVPPMPVDGRAGTVRTPTQGETCGDSSPSMS